MGSFADEKQGVPGLHGVLVGSVPVDYLAVLGAAAHALTAGQSASVVFLNTAIAACAGLLAWALVERIRLGSASSMGAASGLISALVAITPACGAVSPLGALAIGLIAGAVCSLAIELKFRLGFDDSLDVVGVRLMGGILGTLLIGLFATEAAPNKVNGLFTAAALDCSASRRWQPWLCLPIPSSSGGSSQRSSTSRWACASTKPVNCAASTSQPIPRPPT